MLINPWYVVTAAHCVRGPKPIEWVRAGGHLVEDENKGTTPKYGTQLPPYQQQRITDEDIIVHEGFRQQGNNIVDDIALIRLPQRVKTNKGTQFACLPLANNASFAALQVSLFISPIKREENLVHAINTPFLTRTGPATAWVTMPQWLAGATLATKMAQETSATRAQTGFQQKPNKS